MKLDEGQLQEISELVAELNTQRTLDKALRRTNVEPIAGYTGSLGKESYVYGTLSAHNGKLRGFQFLSALIAEIGVNPTITSRLQDVLRSTSLTLEVQNGKYVLLKAGLQAPPTKTPAQAAPQVQATVFVSHRGANTLTEYFAECLVRHLGERVRPWLDHRISGGRWRPKIAENLQAADALVILATPGILRSTFVGYEVGFSDKRLAESKIFVLLAGLTNEQLQDCRPLDEFQSYELALATSLRDFLVKLGHELDLGPLNLNPEALAKDANELGRLVKEEATRHPLQLAGAGATDVDRLLEELEAAMKLARLHTLPTLQPGSHQPLEVSSFDVHAIKDLRDELYGSMTPQCRDAVQGAIERLRHANDLLALANAEDRPGQPAGPRRRSMLAAASSLREPLVLAHANVLIAFGRPPRTNYWQW